MDFCVNCTSKFDDLIVDFHVQFSTQVKDEVGDGVGREESGREDEHDRDKIPVKTRLFFFSRISNPAHVAQSPEHDEDRLHHKNQLSDFKSNFFEHGHFLSLHLTTQDERSELDREQI